MCARNSNCHRVEGSKNIEVQSVSELFEWKGILGFGLGCHLGFERYQIHEQAM